MIWIAAQIQTGAQFSN